MLKNEVRALSDPCQRLEVVVVKLLMLTLPLSVREQQMRLLREVQPSEGRRRKDGGLRFTLR